MVRLSIVLPIVALVAGCGILPSTSGGSCKPTCNGDKTGCPMLGTSLSALEALHAAQPLAQKIFDAAPRWVGAFKGIKITRQGTPSADPEVIEVLGQKTNLYVSGWVFKYCAGMNDVVFGAGPQTSTAQLGCDDFNCEALAPVAEPTVDSAAAIAAAFPGDPADALYELELPLTTNNDPRIWSVTKRPSGPTVKIDAMSGAIVP